jgi:hypothetical protein
MTINNTKKGITLKWKKILPSKSASEEPVLWTIQLLHVSGLIVFLELSEPNWDPSWSSLIWEPLRRLIVRFNEDGLLLLPRLAATFTTKERLTSLLYVEYCRSSKAMFNYYKLDSLNFWSQQRIICSLNSKTILLLALTDWKKYIREETPKI